MTLPSVVPTPPSCNPYDTTAVPLGVAPSVKSVFASYPPQDVPNTITISNNDGSVTTTAINANSLDAENATPTEAPAPETPQS